MMVSSKSAGVAEFAMKASRMKRRNAYVRLHLGIQAALLSTVPATLKCTTSKAILFYDELVNVSQ
jgi:hypothetical protein